MLKLKALTMARLGKSGEAEREFARFLNVVQDAGERAFAEAAFGCYTGNAVNALRELDQCLRERAADSGFCITPLVHTQSHQVLTLLSKQVKLHRGVGGPLSY